MGFKCAEPTPFLVLVLYRVDTEVPRFCQSTGLNLCIFTHLLTRTFTCTGGCRVGKPENAVRDWNRGGSHALRGEGSRASLRIHVPCATSSVALGRTLTYLLCLSLSTCKMGIMIQVLRQFE